MLALVQAMEPRTAYFRCWAIAVLVLALVQAMEPRKGWFGNRGGLRSFWAFTRGRFWSLAG